MSNSGKKATDDDMLLKLNLNSHMARASASAAIDPDLDRRFQALKKPQKPAKVNDSMKKVPKRMDTGDSKVDGAAADDDLFARFAALKNSIPSHNRNEHNKSDFLSEGSVNQQVTEEESEDEVEKVIKWAIDAARLDPSPPSDDDDNNNDGSDDDDGSDDNDDGHGVNSGKKGKRK